MCLFITVEGLNGVGKSECKYLHETRSDGKELQVIQR